MSSLLSKDVLIIIFGNIVSLIATLIYCYGRFKKDKSKVLKYNIISKIFNALTYLILGIQSGIYAFLVHIPSGIFAKLKVDRKENWHLLFVMFETCYLVIGLCSYPTDGIKAILICLASTITLITNWYCTPQHMRLWSFPNSAIYISFYILGKNYLGAISESLVIASNLASYLKFRSLDKKEKNLKSKFL